MDIQKGIILGDPPIFLPWDIDETHFVDLFKDYEISFVTQKGCDDKYYCVADIPVFGETHCNIGVKFEKNICAIDVSRRNLTGEYDDYVKSFSSFQNALIREFGQPNKTKKDCETKFNYCEWNMGGIRIYHTVMNRFGLTECLRLERV